MASAGTTRASVAAFFLLFVFALSLPPKWASLHIAGLALVFAVGFARRADWRSVAIRSFLLCTALWLVPVLLTASLQHALGVAGAPDWPELLKLVLRMLGIGLGVIILIQRGWLTLPAATLALLCALSIHAGVGLMEWGLMEWLVSPGASPGGWRELRVTGLLNNPNPFGTFMALTAILAAGLLRGQPRSLYLWGLLIAALFCVWASGSRGAILVAAVGLAVLFPPRSPRSLVFYLGCAATIAAIYLYTGVQMLSPDSDSQRFLAFSFASEKIRQAPWLGWGIGAYEHFPDRIGPNAPHNMWLDLAVSSGLVALAGALLSVALLVVRLYRQNRPAARLALAVFVAVLVAGTLEYSILDSTHFRGVWVVVVALACCTLNEHCGSHKAVRRAGSPGTKA